MEPRARRSASALALGALLALFGVRFAEFLGGGVLYFRDAGFFFTPWRTLTRRLLADGLPVWNDWLSNGRPFAADPNAAVFWPLSPLLLVLSPTGLALVNLALLLVLFYAALRALDVTPLAAASGAAVVLFSGVYQTLPVFIGVPAAAAPVALAVVAFGRVGFGLEPRALRGALLGGAALALSFLAGEPVITATGGAASAGLALSGLVVSRPPRPVVARRLAAVLAGVVLALGLSAIQLLPTLGELRRSARGTQMAAEHGALFWSVRPSRLLTLLEPRLTGDPFAASATGYWGEGTFDAGNPYFYDLAIGLLPLALAAAGWRDGRGRAALAVAGAAAVLSFGRFLPGYAAVGERLAIFRYPEKWWLLATLALAAAAAMGVERLGREEPEERTRALRTLGTAALGLLAPVAVLLALAALAPESLRALLWTLGLGAGETSASAVASTLRGPLGASAAALLLVAGVAFASARASARAPGPGARGGLLSSRSLVFGVLSVLFLADAARRVAGTCPAGAPSLYDTATPAVALVMAESPRGRFYDDGADDPATAVRRTRDADGFDRLRPAAGVLFGIRYALENDIDRMTSPASVRAFFETARLPWGEAKIARLRAAGVAVARTAAPPPDPPGVEELGRFGEDRIVRINPTRPEFVLVPEAILARDAEEPVSRIADPKWNPLRSAVIEVPGGSPGSRTAGRGVVAVLARSPRAASLRVLSGEPGGALVIGRTFDPNWRATLDGHPHLLYRADGFLTAAFLPSGTHHLELRYENPLFARGAAVSLASAAAAALALAFLRKAR